jgi:hypothetical protein
MSHYEFIKTTDVVFREFDNYEIGPCALLNRSDTTLVDRCEANDPDIAFWSVYGHLRTGGLECISDHETFEEAWDYMKTLPSMRRIPITPF